MERRTRRSTEPTVALQYLIEAVAARSEVDAIAVVDGDGRVVAGVGQMKPLQDLALLAMDGKSSSPRFDELTAGTDFFGWDVGEFSLVAFGARVRRLPEAVQSMRRILRA